MNFTTLIAKKFMFNRKHIGPSRLTGLIAIIGISLGTMAMILSVSVLNGFESKIIDKIVGFEGDIKLGGDIEFEKSMQILSSIDGVENFIPYVERVGLIMNQYNESRMIAFKSIDISKVKSFYQIDFIESTDFDLPMIYLGRTTAARLNLQVGDKVRLLSPLDQNIGWGLPRSLEVIIGGIFDVQILDFNDKVVFIPEDIGKKLFLRKKGFDGIDIKTGEHSNLKNIKKVIQQKINNSHIETWSEIHKNLFSAMRLEKVGSMIVLSLIVLVGCFNLTTTLMLITIQKIKHFGILTALGASKINIRTIIFKQGFYTGLIGILSGLVLGLSAILIQNIFGIIKLPSDIYFTSNLPMIVRTIDILSILFITLLMIFISSSIASRRIDSVKVIKAIVSDK
ncbi:MAG: FtsX-like permease family protein [Candidatus Neomarinimicrobiota bacterium]|nr:FtsX-like permease family protein [Candidatus Neomarinimicrobiota bacterium]